MMLMVSLQFQYASETRPSVTVPFSVSWESFGTSRFLLDNPSSVHGASSLLLKYDVDMLSDLQFFITYSLPAKSFYNATEKSVILTNENLYSPIMVDNSVKYIQ